MREKVWKLCQSYGVKHLVPIVDVKTRWNLTFDMIKRAIYLKAPLRAMCSNEKTLESLLITETEWSELESLSDLLQKFHRSTNLMSMERHPTICSYLPTLKWLLISLETFIDENSGAISSAAQKGLDKLKEYEIQLELKSSKIPYVATFFNPALKMNFFKEHHYSKTVIKDIQNLICGLLDNEYKEDEPEVSKEEKDEDDPDEFFSFIFKRAKNYKEPKEYQKYVNSPLSTSKVDTIEFWRSQQTELPRMTKLARDILPVQSSSVAVERDFSAGTDLIVPTRCALKRETIRAVMCLKSWLKESVQLGNKYFQN